jgi:hypothetical protein
MTRKAFLDNAECRQEPKRGILQCPFHAITEGECSFILTYLTTGLSVNALMGIREAENNHLSLFSLKIFGAVPRE